MTDNIRVRKRRTASTKSEDFTSSPEVKKLFPPNKVRQRRTIHTKEPLPIDNPFSSLSQNLPTPQLSETTTPEVSANEEKEDIPKELNQFVIDENKVTNPSLTNTIDKIKAELREESRYDPDSLYWDGTHNWDDNDSSDYQHFLGSFE